MFLIKPFITDKSYKGEKYNCYIFSVNSNYNKIKIKKEINKLFGFSVKNIRTMIYPRKDKSKYTKKGFIYGKTNKFKKIIVQFYENQKIDVFNKKEI
ncbi:50S ribosomal protein L23 [Blattabacterium sp. (Nauphoeta cinerea)]|uniref:50S ribosomal protein L23 n=1 Tax=Blattabacterium sp. (Nauphoeta cinerea) TaxID=1316444 RepID=UPI0003B004B7|nr:50S ribosomal protein L23 [Blattabacterium sp. (Nauphoeta cinerea)]AGW86009.1 50S ribosomal protein L23 [Blattabacterium sp. (Nauphoeta cinerea)]